MAMKPATNKELDTDIEKELEDALDIELVMDDEDAESAQDESLDIAASMEDFEAQISQATEELALENRETETADTVPAEAVAAAVAAPAVAKAANDGPTRIADLQPVEAQASARPSAFAAANDDRQKDYKSFVQSISKPVPSTVYWVVALLSVVWAASGLLVGHLLFSPQIWQIGSLAELIAAPYALGLALGIIVPIILFWGFAVMIRRAQEMRYAAQSMTEVAFRLAEPEHIATDRVMMVGQAVRREVQAMGEGIERTLARAVELETLVHTEVN